MKISLDKYSKLTKAEITKTELQLGLTFPNDYKNFVLKYNGAVPEDNIFQNDPTVSVDQFIPISEIEQLIYGIEGFPRDAFPIAEAPSGNFIYIKKNNSEIFFWDHEVENDKKLASSFNEFLLGLQPFDIDSIQLKPGQVKNVWVDPDFKPEF